MKISKTLLPVAVAGTLFSPSPALKADGFSYDGSATLVSQYIWRGFDLNQEDPALQGDFTASHDSGFWFGAWGSMYDFATDDGVEIDLMVGYDWVINENFSVNLGITEYTFTGDTDSSTEYYLGVSFYQFAITYYDDYDLEADYISLDGEFELGNDFTLGLHYGQYEFDAGADNSDYSINLNYAFNDSFSMFGLYSDNDLDVEGAEDYFVIGGTFTF